MLVSHLEAYELELRERLRSINRARREYHYGSIPVRRNRRQFSIKLLIAYLWQAISWCVRKPN